MMKNNHLIFSSISNYNKKRPLSLSYAILNENSNSIIHLLPMHGEKLSLRPGSGRPQAAALEGTNLLRRLTGLLGKLQQSRARRGAEAAREFA